MYTQFVDLLKERKYTITFAESCTGGLMASSLIGTPGASSVISSSFVTYSEEAKKNILNVKAETIKNYGVVSCEVAKEMAEGAKKLSGASISVSVTGCAGPGDDKDGNKAGTICFGFIINDIVISEKKFFPPDTRNKIRENAVKYAFEKIYYFLQKL